MKIGFVSLGCSKNLVDTEFMMGSLIQAGHQIVNHTDDADAVIVNTCGFINDAKEEAIFEILQIGSQKKSSRAKILIATGCLTQRYAKELWDEIPELDAILGVTDQERIAEIVERCANGERILIVENWPTQYNVSGSRILSTPPGWAYLKIAEGCSNHCSYCAIPGIRGPLRSRPESGLVEEAYWLAGQGVKELIVIAQDTTAYGSDLPDSNLVNFLAALIKVPDIEWIRLMYAYPSAITDDLLEIMSNSKVLPYLDIPIQHASSPILQRMGRRYNNEELFSIIDRLRSRIQNITLRTTLMTGFPGENQQDHQRNIELLRKIGFDWAGVFTYSHEDGTAAAKYSDDVDAHTKQARADELMVIQQEITSRINQARVGLKIPVLVENQIRPQSYLCRAWFQAPEVDGICIIESEKQLKIGSFVDVKLTHAEGYDMIGIAD